MNEAKIVKLIKTTLTKRGDGKNDPIRVITQYWDFDGILIFEFDPINKTTEELEHAIKALNNMQLNEQI